MATKTTKVNGPEQHKKAFLDAFSVYGNITQAAKIAEISRTTHYNWLQEDPQYVKDFDQAQEQAADNLEREARRRAVDGVNEPIFYKGEECGAVRKYSDTLLIFLMKGARPEKYKDRVYQESSGPGGGPIETYTLTPEERQARINELIAKRGE